MKVVQEGSDPLVVAIENAQRAVDSFGRYLDAAQALENYIISLVAGPCTECPEDSPLRQGEMSDCVSRCMEDETLLRNSGLPPFDSGVDNERFPLEVRKKLLQQYCEQKCAEESAAGQIEDLPTLFSSIDNPDFATWAEYNNIDFPAVIAMRLNAAIANGNVNSITVSTLILRAQSGDRGALLALYGLAFADAQDARWIEFENQTGMIYHGESGRYYELVPNQGGNCATFVSFGLFIAGLSLQTPPPAAGLTDATSENYWYLGDDRISPNTPNRNYRATDSYPGIRLEEGMFLFEGSAAFTGVQALFRNLEARSSDNNFTHDDQRYEIAMADPNFRSSIGAGDLIYNLHIAEQDDPGDHVLIIIGWSIDIPNYSPSSKGAPPIFPTEGKAREYFQNHSEEYNKWPNATPGNFILWGVDHGGLPNTQQPFARPVTQMGTGGPDTRVVNVEIRP